MITKIDKFEELIIVCNRLIRNIVSNETIEILGEKFVIAHLNEKRKR